MEECSTDSKWAIATLCDPCGQGSYLQIEESASLEQKTIPSNSLDPWLMRNFYVSDISTLISSFPKWTKDQEMWLEHHEEGPKVLKEKTKNHCFQEIWI